VAEGPVAAAWWRRPLAPVGAAVLLGAGLRLWLVPRYAGWEESDYGNLAMIRGVLDSGFRHYDMNHMPGYYALGAAALAVAGDARLAAVGLSLVAGLVAFALAVGLAVRLGGVAAGWVALLLLLVQPEFALYSSTSLREPVYAMWVLGCIGALLRERLWLAGLFAALAFSVRMDALAALAPALVVHALGAPGRPARLLGALVPPAAAAAAWSAYCAVQHGTWRFWDGSVQNNLVTGGAAPDAGPTTFARDGLQIVGALWTELLPTHLGLLPWLLPFLALALLPWRSHGAARTTALVWLGLLGVWSGIAFLAQHEPGHNLYWKWLMPIVPVATALGVGVAAAPARRLGAALGPLGAALLLLLALAQALHAQTRELARQVALSEALYRPQRALGEWIEAEVPEEVPLVLDNIPGRWVDRRPHGRTLWSWFDVPSRPGDPRDFARWLQQERIGYVLWFREDWTGAPRVAPFLAGGSWESGELRLRELRREDGYGWILFAVEPTGRLDSGPGLR
jgi:4-amino-4-deoxy-L-arabinose transferase-like glycosyltransferase